MQTQFQSQAFSMQTVGVGMRFLALFIDGVLLGVVLSLIAFATGTPIPLHTTSVFGIPLYINTPIVFGLSILPLLYLIVMEAVFGGTLGKLILGLRVVSVDGAPINWGQSIVRNLLRIVDGLFAYIVGAIFIWTSPRQQRLGDRIAKTLVIKRR